MTDNSIAPPILQQRDFENNDIHSATETLPIGKRFFGQVKWFNTKAGYGFITVCRDGSDIENKDIFVHYSSLMDANRPQPPLQRLSPSGGVADDAPPVNPHHQYKFLLQGEYVEFSVVKPDSDKYEYHAVGVSGIFGGNIMCEIRKTGGDDFPRGMRASQIVNMSPSFSGVKSQFNKTHSVIDLDGGRSSRPTRFSVPPNAVVPHTLPLPKKDENANEGNDGFQKVLTKKQRRPV